MLEAEADTLRIDGIPKTLNLARTEALLLVAREWRERGDEELVELLELALECLGEHCCREAQRLRGSCHILLTEENSKRQHTNKATLHGELTRTIIDDLSAVPPAEAEVTDEFENVSDVVDESAEAAVPSTTDDNVRDEEAFHQSCRVHHQALQIAEQDARCSALKPLSENRSIRTDGCSMIHEGFE